MVFKAMDKVLWGVSLEKREAGTHLSVSNMERF